MSPTEQLLALRLLHSTEVLAAIAEEFAKLRDVSPEFPDGIVKWLNRQIADNRATLGAIRAVDDLLAPSTVGRAR